MSLREAVIRIARENPETRVHLLPLLQKKVAEKWLPWELDEVVQQWAGDKMFGLSSAIVTLLGKHGFPGYRVMYPNARQGSWPKWSFSALVQGPWPEDDTHPIYIYLTFAWPYKEITVRIEDDENNKKWNYTGKWFGSYIPMAWKLIGPWIEEVS